MSIRRSRTTPAHDQVSTPALTQDTQPRNEGAYSPEFLRLPHPGQKCQVCGLSRSTLNELVLATPENGFKPPVRSFVLRKRGAKTGIRLIDYESLREFIRRHPADDSQEAQAEPTGANQASTAMEG